MPMLKPANPVWQTASAPAGCRLYLPLYEGAGTVVRDLSRRSGDGTLVGAVAWQRGVLGPQLGDFATSRYVAIDPPTPIHDVYPHWTRLLFVSTATGTTNEYLWSAGWSGGTTPFVAFRLNNTVNGRLQYQLRDNSGTIATAQLSTSSVNDGRLHELLGVSRSASDHRLYLDGVEVASSTTAIGVITLDRLTLGVLRHTGAGIQPTAGQILAFAAGNGSVPDAWGLAQDGLSGTFAAVRPRNRPWLWGAILPPPPTTQFAAATLTGIGTATLALTAERSAAATLTGTGTAALAVTPERFAAGLLAGAGAATLDVSAERRAAALLAGVGTAVLTVTADRFVAAHLTGTGLATLNVRPEAVTLRQGLVAHLRTDDSIAALVGRRIYSDALPQGVALPALTYTVLGDRKLRDLDGKTGIREARIEVASYSDRKSGCVALAAAVDERLDPDDGEMAPDRDWAGVTIRWCHQDTEQDVTEPVPDGNNSNRYLLPVVYIVNYLDER